MELIGLSGFARSGKDTAAAVLVEEFGFVKVAFADKLRDMIYALNPIVVADARHHGMFPEPDYSGKVYKRLQDVIDEYGWDNYKTCPFYWEIRELLQRQGTEAGRLTLWDTIWIDAALTGLPEDARVVVSDCRFKNEARAIRDRGGSIVRIDRPGTKAANEHPSEHDLDGYDFDGYITNDGTTDDYRQTVIGFANRLGL